MTKASKTDELVQVASGEEDEVAATMALEHVATLARNKVNEYAAAYVLQMIRAERRRKVAEIERRAFEQREAKIRADYSRPEAVAKRSEIDLAYEARQRQHNRELFTEMQEAADKYAAKMRVEWTAELLEAKFSRSDGTSVAWGSASRADHEERVVMHFQHAMTGMQGASRHKAALELLDKTGANTLNEAVEIAA
jgi:hypothetical protein